MTATNKTTQMAGELKLIAGVEKHLSKVTIHIGGKAFTTKEIVNVLQARIDATNASSEARAAWHAKVSEEQAQHAATKQVVDGLRQVLLVMFGSAIGTLNDFGLAPRTRREPDALTKFKRAEKAKATRAARHTMGKRQKLSIEGEVPETSPPTTAAAPATAPAPVPVVSGGNGAVS